MSTDLTKYTAAQIRFALQLALYRKDFSLFASDHLRVRPKQVVGRALVPFRLNYAQQRVNEIAEQQYKEEGWIRLCILKARQPGISTWSAARSFHMSVLNEHVASMTIAHDEETANHVFNIIRIFYEHLPRAYKPQTRYDRRGELVFASKNDDGDVISGSRLHCQTARNAMSGTGHTLQSLHLSEASKYAQPENLWTSINPSVPDMPDTSIILESTAHVNGEWFRSFCNQTQEGANKFRFIFIPWYWVEEYKLDVPKGRRINLTTEEKFWTDEYGLTREQIYWYRMKIEDYGGDAVARELVAQEYPCIEASQRVGTHRGYVPIADVQETDFTSNGYVTKKIFKGRKNVVKIQTERGYSLICTENHKIPDTENQIFDSKDLLNKTIKLIVPLSSENIVILQWDGLCGTTTILKITPDFARLLGYFMGDGSYDAGGQVSIVCDAKDTDVIEDVTKLFNQFFGNATLRNVGKNNGGTEIRVGCKEFKYIMQRLGIYRENTKPFRKVCVPESIFQSPIHIIHQFLRGLFEADGHARFQGSEIILFSKHRDFLEDIQRLLLICSITCSVKSSPRRTGNHHYIANELRLGRIETELFREHVGFVSERKQSRLEKIANRRLHPNAKPFSLHDTVISIEPHGISDVYDLTIEPHHAFDASGILVHNCTPEGAWINLSLSVFDPRKVQELYAQVSPAEKRAVIMPGPRVLDSQNGELSIWEDPKPGIQYDIGVDVATGVEHGDWSVACVMDRQKRRQVAEWRGHIDPILFGEIVYWLGMYYNTAQVAVEITGIGFATNDVLTKKAYPYVYIWRTRGEITPRLSHFAGWKTSRDSKSYLVSLAKHYIMRGEIEIRSPLLWQEMRTFAMKGQDEYGAAPGFNDDAVIAWLIAIAIGDDERADMVTLEPDRERPYVDPALVDDFDWGQTRSGNPLVALKEELGM